MNALSDARLAMTKHHSSTTRSARVARIVAVCTLAALAGACKHGDDPTRVAGWSLVDASQRHPILVSQKPTTLALSVSRGSSGLTPRQRADVLDFAASYRGGDAGNSRLVISAPSGGANEVAGVGAVHEIRELLSENGFAEASLVTESYPADGNAHAPVRVSYVRYVAEAPECGAWPTNLARDPSNVPYANFGCATQRNFAMHVANPADLLGPRGMTSRAAERRDEAFGKYVKGDITSAKKSQDERVKTEGE
jgi:pilus assembly protein CpaD